MGDSLVRFPNLLVGLTSDPPPSPSYHPFMGNISNCPVSLELVFSFWRTSLADLYYQMVACSWENLQPFILAGWLVCKQTISNDKNGDDDDRDDDSDDDGNHLWADAIQRAYTGNHFPHGAPATIIYQQQHCMMLLDKQRQNTAKILPLFLIKNCRLNAGGGCNCYFVDKYFIYVQCACFVKSQNENNFWRFNY